MMGTTATTDTIFPRSDSSRQVEGVPRQRYKTLLLFGAPGAGKGTVGKALGAIPGFVHVACGDVFRSLDMGSSIGNTFVDYSSQGLLVPDDVTIQLWREFIDGLVGMHRFVPERDFLVLDGIPRNKAQAEIMDDYIDVQRVFHLVCSDENLMIQRLRRRALKENRLDDASEEVIRRRWEVYDDESRPVLAHYNAENVVQVDAIASPVKVLYDILGSLLTMPS